MLGVKVAHIPGRQKKTFFFLPSFAVVGRVSDSDERSESGFLFSA